jgi:hypothetical protein
MSSGKAIASDQISDSEALLRSPLALPKASADRLQGTCLTDICKNQQFIFYVCNNQKSISHLHI